MANTLIPIQTYTLTGTTASVTFSNIPQSYTDLKIVASVRGTRALTYDGMNISFNGTATNSNWSTRVTYGTGSGTPAGSSGTDSGIGWIVAANAVAGIYGNVEYYIPNYTSANNKVISVDSVTEDNAGLSITQIAGGVWTVTSAITSITLAPSTNSFASGSTFTLYGISNGVKATGGTIICAGGYAYHTFTSTGSFLPTQQIKGAEVLAVAGGGAGGTNYGAGGGGGAGGVLYANSVTLNAGNTYTALVGAGASTQGAINTPSTSGNGSNSVFSSLIAIGGGGGASYNATPGSGGSGGGAGGADSATTGGSGTPGQGNNGGSNPSVIQYAAAGGGGAGAAGASNSAGPTGGNGGVGTSAYSSWHAITGTGVSVSGTYYIAGGGGGGAGGPTGGFTGTPGNGGFGGGSAGQSGTSNASNATANTGGGGGGIRQGTVSGNGGSGLIIIRYPLA